MSENCNTLVAMWCSRGRKYWVKLHHDGICANWYSYVTGIDYRIDGGGTFNAESEDSAIAFIQTMVDNWLGQADSAKAPLQKCWRRFPKPQCLNT